MADYAKATSDLKARLDAKTRIHDFFAAVRSSLLIEVEKANSALVYEGLAPLELKDQPSVELICAGAMAVVTLDILTPAIATVIHGHAGETTLTFTLDHDEAAVFARRASLTPAAEAKLTAAEIAEIIVEALIAEAP